MDHILNKLDEIDNKLDDLTREAESVRLRLAYKHIKNGYFSTVNLENSGGEISFAKEYYSKDYYVTYDVSEGLYKLKIINDNDIRVVDCYDVEELVGNIGKY